MNDTILQLQNLEQNLAMLRTQKNSVQAKLIECENALSEVVKSQTCYRFVGNIMVRANSDELGKELSESKARLQKTKDSLQRQEEMMVQTKERLQTEILG
jgi:prefoldin beta subunit